MCMSAMAVDGAYAASRGRLILVLPANGARATVVLGCQHVVRTVASPPRGDGIHPPSYAQLAQNVRAITGLWTPSTPLQKF